MASVMMPQLGESVTEGTIAKWLKREGDAIAKYEPLVEVITDKVNSEIPSPEAGIIARISVPEGHTVKVGTEIAFVDPPAGSAPGVAEHGGSGTHASSEVVESLQAAAHAGQASSATQQLQDAFAGAAQPPATPPSTTATGQMDTPESPANGPRYGDDELRKRSSPLVRRLAKEHGIDLGTVPGSGTGGRVTKEDMLARIEALRAAPAPVAVTPAPAAAALPVASEAAPAADEEALPATAMRRAIAEHMVRSVTTAPHAWTYVEVDVSGLVQWRERSRDEFRRREGFDLTYLPFVCKALVEALREHPLLNSTWRAGQVVLKKRIHLGVAVALDDGLVVPVIRDADEKNVVGLARALNDLVGRARAGKLTPEDVQGGTFTLNNTGALGSVLSMPIINQPQAAILTMEAIGKRVVVTADDAIAVRSMLNLCLSFDHRICDGLQVGRFLQSIKARLTSGQWPVVGGQ